VEAAQGDPAKFDALYELHFERVYASLPAECGTGRPRKI